MSMEQPVEAETISLTASAMSRVRLSSHRTSVVLLLAPGTFLINSLALWWERYYNSKMMRDAFALMASSKMPVPRPLVRPVSTHVSPDKLNIASMTVHPVPHAPATVAGG